MPTRSGNTAKLDGLARKVGLKRCAAGQTAMEGRRDVCPTAKRNVRPTPVEIVMAEKDKDDLADALAALAAGEHVEPEPGEGADHVSHAPPPAPAPTPPSVARSAARPA